MTPAIVILGADALLAARPATPGQLANACYAAGYSAVIPSSWGDELVAAGCLREIAARGQGSVVLCSCPRVAERMRRVTSLLPQLLPMASPPVAAARYLRARAGRHGVHITYVGDCPGGSDSAIDRHATPSALLRSLSKRGINLTDQPSEVDERLLRDGRRFYSLPGGAPAPNWLYVEKRGYTLVEPTASDFLAEVAFRVSKKERRVVDLAPRLGCACSGVVSGEPWAGAREKVAAAEPPRAVHEVLDHDVPLDLSASLDPWTGSANGVGEQTIPITLDALASLYNPESKTDPVRSLEPSVLPPRSRPNGGRSAEPDSLSSAPTPQRQGAPSDIRALINSLTRAPGEPKTRPTEPSTRPIPDKPKEPTTLPLPELGADRPVTNGHRPTPTRTNERTIDRLVESTNGRTNGHTKDRTKDRKNERTNERSKEKRTNERTKERATNERIKERGTNERAKEQRTNERTNERAKEQRTNERTKDPRTNEPRTNEPRTNEPRTNGRTNEWRTNEPRTAGFGRRADMSWNQSGFGQTGMGRRLLIFIAVIAMAAGGIALAQHALSTYASQQPTSRSPAAPAPAVPAPASPAPTLAAAPSPSPLNATPDGLDTTSAAPLPAVPDLPRAPVGPMAGAGPGGLVASHEEGVPTSLGHFRPNPAPVYSPGAAPIPRPAGRSGLNAASQSLFPLVPVGAEQKAQAVRAQPSDDLPPPLALRPASSPPTPAEVIAIRLEIIRRRHRVDSLARIVDSLRVRGAN